MSLNHRASSVLLAVSITWLFGAGRCVDRLPQSPRSRAVLEVHTLAAALSLFRFDVGRYPSTVEGLQALMLDPGAENRAGPYLSGGLPVDFWGKAFQYRAVGANAFEIWSLGADGEEGGTG
ncbi:MAG: type II secretion system protein GspG [Acidobacteria bacterium]|nr:MAG: type II secretion system protein GspG [Acidobacteriota bacterium]